MRTATSPCLPEDTVIAFFDGTLAPDELAQLEGHVDECEVCRAWISTMATTLAPADATPARPTGGRCFAAGVTVADRYRIVRFVAAGGMGEVYEAEDLELHHRIALKTVTAVMAGDGDAIARMRGEVLLARKVTHANVCRIFDFGVDVDQGVAFLTMELLAGETLAVRLARLGPFTTDAALPLVRQMADGLSAAHAAGVVHRDLKPHNVIIVDDVRGPRAVLTDFGLAAALDDERGSAPGEWIGTPHYMAPEQLTGGPITMATDVYALGVVLHQMLLGELPFEGVTRRTVARVQLQTEAPSPRVRRPDLDVRWARAIERCLEREPGRRFAAPRDVIAAIAPAPGFPTRWRWLLAGVGALIAASLAVGFAAWHRTPTLCREANHELAAVWNPAEQNRVHAAFVATGAPYAEQSFAAVARMLDGYGAAWTAMRTDACEATRVQGTQSDSVLELRMACLDDRLDELHAQVAELDGADVAVVRRGAQAPAGLTPIASCANVKALAAPVRAVLAPGAVAVDRQLRGELEAARALLTVGRPKQGIPLATAVRDGAHQLHDGPLEAEALLLIGQSYLDAREWQLADGPLVEAATTALAARHDLVVARAWSERLWLLGAVRIQFEQARDLEPFARAALERVGSPHDEAAVLERNVAAMYEEHGDLTLALAHDDKALELAGDSLLGSRVLEATGTVYNRLGRFAEACDRFERSLALMKTQLGVDHPVYGAVLNLYGQALWGLGRHDESIDVQRRGLAIEERTLGPDDVDVAYGLTNLAIALKAEHQLVEAIALQQRGVAILQHTLGPNHPDVAHALGNLGRSFMEQGKPARDLECQQQALGIATAALGPNHLDRAFYLANLGEAQLALDAPKLALAPLEEAVKIFHNHDEDPTDLAHARFLLARALGPGDRRRARELATAARAAYAATDPPDSDTIAEIDAWLRAHG